MNPVEKAIKNLSKPGSTVRIFRHSMGDIFPDGVTSRVITVNEFGYVIKKDGKHYRYGTLKECLEAVARGSWVEI